MKRGLRFLALALILGLAVGLFVDRLRERMGADRPARVAQVTPPLECRVVEGPRGAEDLQIDAATGLAVISATDRRTEGAQGDLWLLDLARPGTRPVRLERTGPPDFRPHGLGLVRRGERLHAWVVNHPAGGHSVEAFEIDPVARRATHGSTVTGDALVSPNDVVAVDAERFYASNDHGAAGGFVRLSEDLAGVRLADVVYHDGTRIDPVLDGLSFANGVTLSRDGAVLMVAETMAGTVTFADREPNSGALAPFLVADLDTGVDNLDVAPDGSVWTAGHPDLFAFLDHAGDASARSPTEVWRIVRRGEDADIDLVWVDDGDRLPGGSVAAAWGDQLLIGAVFAPRLVRCTLPPELAVGGRPPVVPVGTDPEPAPVPAETPPPAS